MNHRTAPCLPALALTAALAASLAAQAATDTKDVAVDAVPAAPALSQWAVGVTVQPLPVPQGPVLVVPLQPQAPGEVLPRAQAEPARTVPAAARYEPWPVVLGVPELPLLGAGAARAGQGWSPQFNYQGLLVQVLPLDAAGQPLPARALSAPLLPGERFKLRVAATFDAVSEVALVLGAPYDSQRAGQVYPAAGYSVQLPAGHAVDLPLEAQTFFVMGSDARQRLLLNVRAPEATEARRSQQPAYRQDAAGSSRYLQLVPAGQRPAFEQLLSVAAR